MKSIYMAIGSLFFCIILSSCRPNQTVNSTVPTADKTYLLKPTGEYEVGFQDFRLVNGTLQNGTYTCDQSDLFYTKGKNETDFGKDNQTKFCREMMVRVYYPAKKGTLPNYENYYAPAINDLKDQIRSAKISGVTESDIESLSQIKTFTIRNPDIENQKFPVLIFDPGSGQTAEQYENTIENLASHGYIVVAVNNTFIGNIILFPDGRFVENAVGNPPSPSDPIIKKADTSILNDILFVRHSFDTGKKTFQNLTDHMSLDSIGLFGHSAGAIVLVKAVRDDHSNLFQSAVSLDAAPVLFGERIYSSTELAGFQIPFLRFFAAEWRGMVEGIPRNAQFQLLSNNYYALLSPNEDNTTYTNHGSFIDFSTLQYQPTIKSYIATLPQSLGTADGWHIAKVINEYVLSFFDHYLKKKPSTIFEGCNAVGSDTLLQCPTSKAAIGKRVSSKP